jgi:hypothetical protein
MIPVAEPRCLSAFTSLEEDAKPFFVARLKGKLDVVGLESQDAVMSSASVSMSCMTTHALDAVLRQVAASYRSSRRVSIDTSVVAISHISS